VSEPVQTGPVRVSPGEGPGLVKRVEPKYPPIAQAARMEGTVILDAVIHQDGTVGEITVLRSANPLFDQSAIDALKQWRYTPGPYDVILTVTVNFTMR
jgi:protein TonB